MTKYLRQIESFLRNGIKIIKTLDKIDTIRKSVTRPTTWASSDNESFWKGLDDKKLE